MKSFSFLIIAGLYSGWFLVAAYLDKFEWWVAVTCSAFCIWSFVGAYLSCKEDEKRPLGIRLANWKDETYATP